MIAFEVAFGSAVVCEHWVKEGVGTGELRLLLLSALSGGSVTGNTAVVVDASAVFRVGMMEVLQLLRVAGHGIHSEEDPDAD